MCLPFKFLVPFGLAGFFDFGLVSLGLYAFALGAFGGFCGFAGFGFVEGFDEGLLEFLQNFFFVHVLVTVNVAAKIECVFGVDHGAEFPADGGFLLVGEDLGIQVVPTQLHGGVCLVDVLASRASTALADELKFKKEIFNKRHHYFDSVCKKFFVQR